jgi:hypothetical protein
MNVGFYGHVRQYAMGVGNGTDASVAVSTGEDKAEHGL